jgi:hypothetical protein
LYFVIKEDKFLEIKEDKFIVLLVVCDMHCELDGFFNEPRRREEREERVEREEGKAKSY